MADILLLEPAYKNKYPPLGLMKISYFHKHIKGDYVRFAKGKLPEEFNEKKWDRVYVTTLFTFEWENTKKALEYALSVAKNPEEVYAGGVFATLMPEVIAEHFPTVKVVKGLLNTTDTIGLANEECIDTLTPDYSILDDIASEYIYPAHDAYFTYMTRGCGMRCQFCAVQTLEPKYIPYISIKESLNKIEEEYGPKKDLLLMDNNVLISKYFDQIIDEIKELGFEKGATYINPKTGKKVQRYVDFNQGLDAFLLSPYKVKRLSELALRPARIAFDHIEDEEAYVKAIRLCAENGITHMSNYLLYNGEQFTGKGNKYKADTPEDLYQRMKITLDLCDQLNEELDNKITIFSFPMRYIPLNALKRGFVGTNWNPKYLRAVQRMLIPTQGKGVSSRSFFEADFGKSAEEFVEALAMPESHIGWRGHFVDHKDESSAIRNIRYAEWKDNHAFIEEWKKYFRGFNNQQRTEFIGFISDNDFTLSNFNKIKDKNQKKLFIHYFTTPTLLKIFSSEDYSAIKFISDYISREFPLIYKRMISYVLTGKPTSTMYSGLLSVFGDKFVKDLLRSLDFNNDECIKIINSLIKAQKVVGYDKFNFSFLKIFKIYSDASVFDSSLYDEIVKNIKELDNNKVMSVLNYYLPDFEKILKERALEQAGEEYLLEEIDSSIQQIKKLLIEA